ncbi:MAG TPA: alpha/beta family hydrolase [Acidimicrobiales bacterium]|nr:alpha/beta family hydrolase [Acidimicrobiales bacterium]
MTTRTRPAGLFLTPGAGSSADHSSLRAIEAAVSPLPVVRHDFPYRREGRRAPDRAPKLLADIAAAVPGPGWVLGGRSMGGRMCSMAVADGLVDAAGLVLICYPLHAPGKPDKPRTEHLPRLTVPCLFISGTKDAFGTPAELEAAASTIPGPVTHVWVEGKGHDLKGSDALLAETVARWLRGLRGSGPRARGGRSRGSG